MCGRAFHMNGWFASLFGCRNIPSCIAAVWRKDFIFVMEHDDIAAPVRSGRSQKQSSNAGGWERVQRELRSHRVLVRSELAETLPRVLWNPVQLQQVMINLTTNAIDAMNSVSNRERMLRVASEVVAAARSADHRRGLRNRHRSEESRSDFREVFYHKS